jgi:hypothetical protein
MKAFVYSREICVDSIHDYCHTIEEMAIEIPSTENESETKTPQWVVSTHQKVYLCDGDPFPGLTEGRICHQRGKNRKEEDAALKKKSKESAKIIEVPESEFRWLLHLARMRRDVAKRMKITRTWLSKYIKSEGSNVSYIDE